MTEKQKLRWYQFSLRALLVFVLLVSIGMSWLGVKLDRARRQRKAVEVIEKAGGGVGYEELFYGFGPPDSVHQWARATFGDDFFFDVIEVWVDGADFGDDEAAYLKRLTNLAHLYLYHTQVTDAGLEHLEGLSNLTYLFLDGTQVTTQGIESLRQALPNCDISRESQP